MAENEDEGPIRRAKKSARKPEGSDAPPEAAVAAAPEVTAPASAEAPAAAAPEPAPVAAEAPAPATSETPTAGAGSHEHAPGEPCSSCTRLRAALRADRKRLRRLTEENKTLREELLSAGEMIENLAQDLEKPY